MVSIVVQKGIIFWCPHCCWLYDRWSAIYARLSDAFLTVVYLCYYTFSGRRGRIWLGFDCAVGNPRFVLLVLYTVPSGRRCFNPTFRYKNGIRVLAANNSNRFIAYSSSSVIPLFSSHSTPITSGDGVSKWYRVKYFIAAFLNLFGVQNW